MSDIQGKVFSDFEPLASTDGSYEGTKRHIEATEEHFKMKLEQELAEINQRLKASKTKVKLLITGNTLQHQATLPLKPGDINKSGRSTKQYKISLGIPANFDGLKTAEEEAYELGKLIARKTFTWTDKYLGIRATKDKGITFREFYEQFEKRYFETRKRTRKSQGTLDNYKRKYRQFFLNDLPITFENMKKILEQIDNCWARKSAIGVCRVISKSLSMNVSFNSLLLKEEKSVRNIPSDRDIVFYSSSFEERFTTNYTIASKFHNNWKVYKFIYGLLATYGLRPIEIINKPDLEWFVSEENGLNTFKVHADNKTGYREVVPFVPEWVELFNLKNEDVINLFKEKIKDKVNSSQFADVVGLIGRQFLKANIPFKPYDLRHACAIRAHLQGVPIKAAADNLGHTVQIHTKVYQNWFGFDNRVKAFNQAFEEQSQLQKLTEENTRLRNKLAEKKLQVSILSLILIENKIKDQ